MPNHEDTFLEINEARKETSRYIQESARLLQKKLEKHKEMTHA